MSHLLVLYQKLGYREQMCSLGFCESRSSSMLPCLQGSSLLIRVLALVASVARQTFGQAGLVRLRTFFLLRRSIPYKLAVVCSLFSAVSESETASCVGFNWVPCSSGQEVLGPRGFAGSLRP